MPFIEVRAGGSDIPDGAYHVQLSDIQGPKTVLATRGPNAGQEVKLLDWVFHVAQPGTQYDGQEIVGTTSTASGPKSKLFSWLTALHNGVAPVPGMTFEKDQLLGRLAVATIQKDGDGWPRLINLGALPVASQQAAFVAATAPAAAAAATMPIQQIIPPQQPASPVATAADDLPF